jgi:hypothetical protein
VSAMRKIRFQNIYEVMLLLSSIDVQEGAYNLTKLHYKLIIASNTSKMTMALFNKIIIELEKKLVIQTMKRGRERYIHTFNKPKINKFLEIFGEYKDIIE